MKPQAVYDTNVIISAVLKEGSIPASLVSLALQGAVSLFLSPQLFAEYKEVLNRPVFGFDKKAVTALLKDIEKTAVMVHPTLRVQSALDEPDNRILECALEAKAQYVVTGNKRHFPFAQFKGIRIVSPAEFAGFLVE
jgi:putative PIN family toxin of toxin-antitoxin system